jgi:hypothetical protein
VILNPKFVFIGAILLGLGGWMVTLGSWNVALTPVNLGGLLMVMGSILAPALSKSIVKDK